MHEQLAISMKAYSFLHRRFLHFLQIFEHEIVATILNHLSKIDRQGHVAHCFLPEELVDFILLSVEALLDLQGHTRSKFHEIV